VLAVWNALLAVLWPLLYFYPPFRGEVPQRLGRGLPDWSGGGPRAAGARTFLINAVSAGEVVAIAPFIRELKRRLPECRIALLTTTDSGQEMARGRLGDALDLLAYFPLADLRWAARRYLDRLRPDVYITTESELWPNIQGQCRARGIPVVSLNARIYLHNKTGLRGALVRQLYAQCDLIVCQSEAQRENFRRFGVPEAKLAVSGNTKFDFELPEWPGEQLAAWRAQWGLPPDTPVAVAGSTHPGEDELLLDVLARLRGTADFAVPPRLVLAPRHVERAPGVAELARQRGWQACTLTDYAARGPDAPAWDVLVVDRYGVLVDFYRLANAVVLGGTFSPKVGGHNVLEATALGKPVVVGPYTFSITAQVELLEAAQGLARAGTDPYPALHALLAAPPAAQALGARAQALTLDNRGAAARAADAVLALLDARRPPRGG
jgi:3-deoxy-D-manno-octulosonic-acid transferase